MGYLGATKLDYKALTTPVPTDGSHWWHIFNSFRRYLNSKLANIYFTNELDRRLQARGITNVYCNSCHPGNMSSLKIAVCFPNKANMHA